MKTLSPTLKGETEKQITTPFYLVEFSFTNKDNTVTVTYQLSTRQTVTFEGVVFNNNEPSIDVLTVNSQQAVININNEDLLTSFYILSDDYGARGMPIRIWAVYGIGNVIALADSIEVFNGVMDNVPSLNNDIIKVNCITDPLRYSWTPRIFINPPLCNHIPPAGTVIGTLTLEKR